MEENGEKTGSWKKLQRTKHPKLGEKTGSREQRRYGEGSLGRSERSRRGELADHPKAKGSPQCPWDSLCV